MNRSVVTLAAMALCRGVPAEMAPRVVTRIDQEPAGRIQDRDALARAVAEQVARSAERVRLGNYLA